MTTGGDQLIVPEAKKGPISRFISFVEEHVGSEFDYDALTYERKVWALPITPITSVEFAVFSGNREGGQPIGYAITYNHHEDKVFGIMYFDDQFQYKGDFEGYVPMPNGEVEAIAILDSLNRYEAQGQLTPIPETE